MEASDLKTLEKLQQVEITEHHIYKRISKSVDNEANRKIILRIAEDELGHYKRWQRYTNKEMKPNRFKVWLFAMISWLLGFTFTIKLMEKAEESGKVNYRMLLGKVKEAEKVLHEEEEHEQTLINMLDEERLRYAGSVILGLNDALVELTGALAGFTLALQNTQLIALTGSITGFAAALSMAASEYLSTKTEDTSKHPLKASVYTGLAYLLTVILLISPYLLLENYFLCLGVTLGLAILIIAVFNFYIAVAKDLSFSKRFWEMALLSLGVAFVSFAISFLLKQVLGVDV